MEENTTLEAATASETLIIGPIEQYQEPQKLDLVRTFTAYAPPLAWSNWLQITAHGGVMTYSIGYTAIGDTLVQGEVTYASATDTKTERFIDSTTITTGNFWGVVKVRFYGNPFGSILQGTINP